MGLAIAALELLRLHRRAGVRTFLEARAGHDLHALILSGAEIATIATITAFLEVIACAVLLVVYAVAAVLTAHQDMPLRFVYFAMTAVYIVIADQRRTVSTKA